MGNGKRQNSLLVEIIIAVLFFAMSATVILEVFATAYLQTTYAEACNSAVAEAQNIAARLYMSEAPEATLVGDGFVYNGEKWVHEEEDADSDYVIEIDFDQSPAGAGEMRTANITAIRGEKVILEIPCAHSIPGEVAQ